MTSASPDRCELLVFRDSAGKHRRASAAVLADLDLLLPPTGTQVEALILAAELECALIDTAHPAAVFAARLTDVIAAGGADARSILRDLASRELPRELVLITPEGLAFYALDPAGFPETVFALADPERVAIVGIRSAGVALSALCATRGGSRITVRPHGHPYDRELRLNQKQFTWVQQNLRAGREFFIVDEGPGRSGSSMLSVAEMLELAGVPRERLHLVGSRAVEHTLVARDATRRWGRFDFHVSNKALAPPDSKPLHAGAWRLGMEEAPSVWTQLTPATYLSKDQKLLWKFEGLGSAGSLAKARAKSLAENQSFPHRDSQNGFSAYGMIPGRMATVRDLNPEMLGRIAEYCAYRRNACLAPVIAENESTKMAVHNVQQLLGVELIDFTLETPFPVICDAKLMPYEWFITDHGILKADAVTHGDSHFFPGPCDIAWDIAGAVIEWQMDASATEIFLGAYDERTGDNVGTRLPEYRIAYCAFHAAYARMAGMSVSDEEEKRRFARDAERYLKELKRGLAMRAARMSATRSA